MFWVFSRIVQFIKVQFVLERHEQDQCYGRRIWRNETIPLLCTLFLPPKKSFPGLFKHVFQFRRLRTLSSMKGVLHYSSHFTTDTNITHSTLCIKEQDEMQPAYDKSQC